MKKIRTLSPAQQAFLAETFARNRSRFGGWSMDGSSGGSGDGSGDGGSGEGGGAGGSGGDGSGQGGSGSGDGGDGGSGDGFPKNTPLAEMTDAQQAAYWKHQSRKHEGTWKGMAGDRSPEDVKKALEAHDEHQRSQQTPAEQQLADARNEGKKEGIASVRNETAMATFRGALEANGVTGEDLDELVANFNVSAYIGDDGVDTTKIVGFAKKFAPSGTDTQQQRHRDFGGGNRGNGSGDAPKSVAAVMEARRAAREAKK